MFPTLTVPSLILIVVPSTLTPPSVAVEAVGKVYELTPAVNVPLLLKIVTPSTETTPKLALVATGIKEVERVPVAILLAFKFIKREPSTAGS